MNVLLVEGYYDHTSQSDPVKYKLNLFNPLDIQFNFSVTKTYKMKQNKVKKLDGSIEQFVSYEAKEVLYYDLNTSILASFYFEMDDNYDYYETYIDYQPVIDSSTRNLEQQESSDNKDLMSGGYFAFFMMAQMGGLYTFLKLVFGLFVNHFNTQSLYHAILNQVHESNINSKEEENDHSESDKNLKNKENSYKKEKDFIDFKALKSKIQEVDPLIRQNKRRKPIADVKNKSIFSKEETK